MSPLSSQSLRQFIVQALREDAAGADVTSRAVIPPGLRVRARLVAKARGVVAGVQVATWIFQAADRRLRVSAKRREGEPVRRGQTILTVEGRARSIFAAERTALNFLGHLSGIATLTHAFVQRVKPYPVKILDTRKTLPGLRLLEKYAVRIGGGHSHRSDLAEAILIKTNHLKVLGRGAGDRGRGEVLRQAINTVRRRGRGRMIEVEVSNLVELKAALEAKPDVILLDNWSVSKIRRAVCLRGVPTPLAPRPSPPLEVSGGVTLDNVRAIARAGVDRISIGRLTHSAQALDISLEVKEAT